MQPINVIHQLLFSYTLKKQFQKNIVNQNRKWYPISRPNLIVCINAKLAFKLLKELKKAA